MGLLGTSSSVVNGQLVHVAPANSFDPMGWGPMYTGSMFMRQGVYQVPPVMPSGALASSMSPGSYGGSDFSAYPPNPTQSSASGSPFHPTKSPLWWALGFLIVGILMLQYIHYHR